MKEIIVNSNEANQRLDKLLHKHLNLAGTSFLYKMLRKKNIVLNGRKASGNEIVREGDQITLWLSDETVEKFSSHEVKHSNLKLKCLYEDERILAFMKPAGILSQKSKSTDDSAADYVVQYLCDTKQLTPEDLKGFTPSVCNRLDRNTSGIILAGKTLEGLQYLSEILRTRQLHKYYLAIVKGELNEGAHLKGYLVKDHASNRSSIISKPPADTKADPVETVYEPLSVHEGYTLLRIELLTGKSHQIRAHLSSTGHPIVGDAKYGGRMNGVPFQQLHAWKVILPDDTVITAEPPELFSSLCSRFGLTIGN